MPKLKDADPFPRTRNPDAKDTGTGRGSDVIKTELDTEDAVRFDVVHNYHGDEVVRIAPHIQKNWLCGYVTYPDGCPVPTEEGVVVSEIANVHGGVTYEKKNADGSYTYGFDCAHVGDGDAARTNDPTWVLSEAKRLHKEITRLKAEWWKRHGHAK